MRREERVTVQGPVKEQQPDGMPHRGGRGTLPPPLCPSQTCQTQTWNTTYTPRPGLSIMCAVSQGGKAQNLRPTALTPAREAGIWNCLEHKQGHWPDEHVMN